MSSAEQGAFLRGHHRGVLGTIGPHGHPHLAHLSYVLHHGAVAMTTFARSQKAANLRRSPAASLLVERTDPYRDIQGVLLQGSVEVVDDPGRVLELLGLVRRRVLEATTDAGDVPAVDLAALAAKRVGLLLSVERAASWDHTKLDSPY